LGSRNGSGPGEGIATKEKIACRKIGHGGTQQRCQGRKSDCKQDETKHLKRENDASESWYRSEEGNKISEASGENRAGHTWLPKRVGCQSESDLESDRQLRDRGTNMRDQDGNRIFKTKDLNESAKKKTRRRRLYKGWENTRKPL